MMGELQTSVYRSNIAEIPHLFIFLDACFSGTVAQGAAVRIVNTEGVQRLVEIAEEPWSRRPLARPRRGNPQEAQRHPSWYTP